MGFFKRTGSAGMLNTVAGLLLFLLFAVCSLVIIGAGAGVYSRIQEDHDSTYGSAASIRYITNKIRSGESVEIINGGSGMEHMASFNYGYKLSAVRSWLFKQVKN